MDLNTRLLLEAQATVYSSGCLPEEKEVGRQVVRKRAGQKLGQPTAFETLPYPLAIIFRDAKLVVCHAVWFLLIVSPVSCWGSFIYRLKLEIIIHQLITGPVKSFLLHCSQQGGQITIFFRHKKSLWYELWL